jgi:exopolysaccharide production protein ExoZ
VRWLGNMSYSYYLLHGLALKACFIVLAKALPVSHYGSWLFWALLPLMFGLTLIPTALLFLAVERPLSLAPNRARREARVLDHDHALQKATEADAATARRLP